MYLMYLFFRFVISFFPSRSPETLSWPRGMVSLLGSSRCPACWETAVGGASLLSRSLAKGSRACRNHAVRRISMSNYDCFWNLLNIMNHLTIWMFLDQGFTFVECLGLTRIIWHLGILFSQGLEPSEFVADGCGLGSSGRWDTAAFKGITMSHVCLSNNISHIYRISKSIHIYPLCRARSPWGFTSSVFVYRCSIYCIIEILTNYPNWFCIHILSLHSSYSILYL